MKYTRISLRCHRWRNSHRFVWPEESHLAGGLYDRRKEFVEQRSCQSKIQFWVRVESTGLQEERHCAL